MNDRPSLRIGTRRSELATWQAKQVAQKLNECGYASELVFISSKGDLDLTTPLTEMGGKGVFTKALDDALLAGHIDLAVHSYKDLPTDNPLPLKVAAVLERGDVRDTLVAPAGIDFLDDPDYEAVIATGSNRRKAQWLNRYPKHKIVPLRGNVNTRLAKVKENGWDGAIFAAAGLQRINLEHHISQYLDWMIPAPAQGAVAVMIREDDEATTAIVASLNHASTAQCTAAERIFLNTMEAGCSSPVGAYAYIQREQLHLQAIALSMDGAQRFDYESSVPPRQGKILGKTAADALLEEGAFQVIQGSDND